MSSDRVRFKIINYNNTLELLACGQNSDRNMVIFQFDFILENFVLINILVEFLLKYVSHIASI